MTIRWLAVCASALLALSAAREAAACGGTFCDGPGGATVDQTAETVLFVRDGDFVEAHIQIVIDPRTRADQFAWIVPMQAVPELAVGSQPLFDALLGATTPRWRTQGSCTPSTSSGFIDTSDGGTPKPEVVFDDVVGAFEITVIQGGTVDGVMLWLDENGYTQDPAAAPILADYLAEGFVFVAFKLAPSATTDEVHPVVLRYQGTEPCVPIRLTAIAAAEDMGVRVFALGDHRYVPSNYRHVEINPLRIPWTSWQVDAEALVTLAVDETRTGHGFVTEYAGSSSVVVPFSLWRETFDAAPFATIDPLQVVELLTEQGLADCGWPPCWISNPLLVTMLRKYLPAPEGVAEGDFYPCLSCYADEIDLSSWDGPAFAAELEERVITPGKRGYDLLQTWPYLTRLYTTLSPHEMTVDPMFHENPDLPEVPLPPPAAMMCDDECDGEAVILPDGRAVVLNGSWPSFPGMPWADRIEQIGPFGAPIVEVDNRAEIDAMLAAWNGEQDPEGCMPVEPRPDDGGGGADTMDSYGTSGSASGGLDGNDDNGIAGRGCGCATNDERWPWALTPLALVLRRRRRARA